MYGFLSRLFIILIISTQLTAQHQSGDPALVLDAQPAPGSLPGGYLGQQLGASVSAFSSGSTNYR